MVQLNIYQFTRFHKINLTHPCWSLAWIWGEVLSSLLYLKGALTLRKKSKDPLLSSWKPLSGDWLMVALRPWT